jgi:hypothetical protein
MVWGLTPHEIHTLVGSPALSRFRQLSRCRAQWPCANSANVMLRTDKWTLWQWALFTNVVGAIGMCLGFPSGQKLPADPRVYIAVPVIVLLNLLFLVVRPRIAVASAAGKSPNVTVFSTKFWLNGQS